MSFSVQITEDINWQTYGIVGSSVHHNKKPVIQQGNYSSLLYQSKQRRWYEFFSAESHKPRSYSLIDKNKNRCLKTSHERGTNGNVAKHKRRSGNISQLYYRRKHFLDKKIHILSDLLSLILLRKKATLLQISIKFWPFYNTIREHKESTFKAKESYFFCITS